MTDEEMNRLLKLADAATPGPWELEVVRNDSECGMVAEYGIRDVASLNEFGDSHPWHMALNTLTREDARFIAAANPAAVRALVQRLRDASAERDAALAREAKVRELHRKYTYYEHEDSCENTSEEHREERHRESDVVGEFYCEDMPVSTHCEMCRDEYGDERLEWPCPTIRALAADGKETNE